MHKAYSSTSAWGSISLRGGEREREITYWERQPSVLWCQTSCLSVWQWPLPTHKSSFDRWTLTHFLIFHHWRLSPPPLPHFQGFYPSKLFLKFPYDFASLRIDCLKVDSMMIFLERCTSSVWLCKSFFFHIFLLGKARGSEGGRCLCILKVVSIEYINIVRYFSSLLSLLLWIQLWCQPSSPPFAILKGLMLQSRISE